MTREQYIKYRTEDTLSAILYEFFLEKGTIKLPVEEFLVYFDQWLLNLMQQHFRKTGELVDKSQLYKQVFDTILPYYDNKFNIVYVVTEVKTEVKQSKIFII